MDKFLREKGRTGHLYKVNTFSGLYANTSPEIYVHKTAIRRHYIHLFTSPQQYGHKFAEHITYECLKVKITNKNKK